MGVGGAVRSVSFDDRQCGDLLNCGGTPVDFSGVLNTFSCRISPALAPVAIEIRSIFLVYCTRLRKVLVQGFQLCG